MLLNVGFQKEPQISSSSPIPARGGICSCSWDSKKNHRYLRHLQSLHVGPYAPARGILKAQRLRIKHLQKSRKINGYYFAFKWMRLHVGAHHSRIKHVQKSRKIKRDYFAFKCMLCTWDSKCATSKDKTRTKSKKNQEEQNFIIIRIPY